MRRQCKYLQNTCYPNIKKTSQVNKNYEQAYFKEYKILE